MDDAVWASAPVVAGFKQREPDEGADSSEPTLVRVIYDQTNLYVGAELRDSMATDIRASELRRDNTLESDDTFSVLLDTYHDHRNAFVFRVNPRGTRFDALVRNESRFYYSDWDEQWTAAATLTDTGWTVEIAIPFKILRFTGTAAQTWGINFERIIKRRNESAYWMGWTRNYGFHNVSQAGHLSGLADIKQAERLRLRPYVLAGGEALDAVAAPAGARRITEVGIDDLKLQATSTLTADMAVNPDFAQTEVDAQQVNLTRFSLFFP
ncbi:MAG: carbohydrate binding family 9 domain-containing protein, partial [Vicinamibacterales bacterium]